MVAGRINQQAGRSYPPGLVSAWRKSRFEACGLRFFVVFVFGIFLAGVAFGQPRILNPRNRPAQRSKAQQYSPTRQVLIEPSAPILNLFARADEGIERSDWKFAIDCLQRIVDDPEGSLVPREGGDATDAVLYESASRRAVRRLADLPPAGRRAYHLLFNARAKRLYEKGKAAHDSAMLRVVVNRYLLTGVGDDAVDLLASWALDEGRPGEAVALLTHFFDLVPARDRVPGPNRSQSLLRTKLATAYAMLGRLEAAGRVMQAESVADEATLDSGTAAAVSAALQSFVPGAFQTDPLTNYWPIVGGMAGRQGRMPPVEPSLVDDVPWRFDLPGAQVDAWRRVFTEDAANSLWLPAIQPVAAGSLIFFRTRGGCVALNQADLSVAWEARDPDPVAPIPELPIGRFVSGRAAAQVRSSIPAFEDFVTGELAVGAGLVLTVERTGYVPYTHLDTDPGARRSVVWQPNVSKAVPPPDTATRLLAYDAATGILRWQRGRTGDPLDPLGDAEFRSAPIEVDGALWVPFFRQGDFSLAALDPVDGRLIRTLSLCSSEPSLSTRQLSLSPTSLDGVIYVPSGQGVIFAIDTRDASLRWASQYISDSDGAEGAQLRSRFRRQPTAPIVSGGLVFIAPADYDEVMAFSTADGRLRWSRVRGRDTYLFAADHDRVWLGGRRIACLSSEDGEVLWSTDLPSAPTGRAVVSGAMVHVPLLGGLVTLDALTGEHLAYAPTGAGDQPLGNLLCLSNSMFVMNPSGVRRYPDIQRSYAAAKALHDAHPTDVVAGLDRAWLEFLRGDPAEALAIVAGLSFSDEALNTLESGRLASGVSRLRVQSLLVLAARAAKEPFGGDDALRLFVRAREASEKSSDRLRCRLALAEQLRSMGRNKEAHRELWDLGLSADADQFVPLADYLEGLARFDIARRLRLIDPTLTPTEREELHAQQSHQVRTVLAEARSRTSEDPLALRRAWARIEAMGDLEPNSPTRQDTLLMLADHHAQEFQFEKAEQVLRECIRHDANSSLTLSAFVRLADLYVAAQREGIDCSRALLDVLELLEQEAETPEGEKALLAVLRAGRAEAGGAIGERDEIVSVAGWVEHLRDTTPVRLRDEDQRRGEHSPIRLTNKVAWTRKWETRQGLSLQTIGFDGPVSSALEGRVLLYGPISGSEATGGFSLGEVVSCLDGRSGELLWQTELRLPGDFRGVLDRVRVTTPVSRRRAVVSAQTAIFSSREGMFAVGLLTGKRLWVRSFEFAGEGDIARHQARQPAQARQWIQDQRMAAGDGLLAAVIRTGHLTLIRIRDGATVWERDLRDEPIAYVRMVGNRIITMDLQLQRVNIFKRNTGQYVKRITFKQPDPEGKLVNLIFTDSAIVGPMCTTTSDSVKAIDLTSGETRWQVKLNEHLVQLFMPTSGVEPTSGSERSSTPDVAQHYVGLGLLGGGVQLIQTQTGEPTSTWRVTGTQRVVGGALVDGTLIVQFMPVREGEVFRHLASIDLATGQELWRRDDVMSAAQEQGKISVFAGQVAVFFKPKVAPKRKRRTYLTMIDVRTGENVGERVFPIRGGQARLRGDLQLMPMAGIALVGTESAIHALAIDTDPQEKEQSH